MKSIVRYSLVALILIFATLLLGAGYASVIDNLKISGTAHTQPPQPEYDVYITNVSPETSAGVSVNGYSGTTLSLSVTASGTAQFNITVLNRSEKTYVFERVIDGAEAGIDGIYSGTDITYSLSGIKPLDELAYSQATTFTLTVSNPKAIKTDSYVLKFNFIEKTGTEILPGNPDEPDVPVDPDPPVDPDDPDPPVDPDPPTGDDYHDDFLGLVEALLSTNTDCLNDSDVIFNAVIETLTSGKRPDEDAPIVHCSVNSISGGTMSSVAEFANAKLTDDLQFIFEADSDPAYKNNRMFLYMYYEKDIDAAKTGDEILVYKQIVTRGNDGVWIADSTYIGRAQVGNFYGGGKNGKDVWTINPYSWKAGAP